MKKSLLAGLAATALIGGSATAADLARPVPVYQPPPPVVAYFSWTGCYVGANGGGLWSRKEWTNNVGLPVIGPTVVAPGTSFGSFDTNGGLGGLQVGCNYQAGAWVFGIQGDYDWTSANATGNAIAITPLTTFAGKSTINSIASVTGRVGYSWDRFLGYVKAGGAWERDDHSVLVAITGVGTGSLTASETRSGWTVGVGGEYAFLNWLTGFIEYDYYSFGTSSNSFACGLAVCGTVPVLFNIKDNVNVLKVGVNFKFGG